MTHVLEQSKAVANTPYGAVFRMHIIPLLGKDFVYTTDYKLARLVLLGDPEKNVKESIKKVVLRSFNFIDRNVSSLFTYYNAIISATYLQLVLPATM